jgi:hypothetical protein
MPKPNSFTTVLRRAIVKIVEPLPEAGYAWCLDCALNQGKTKVLHADRWFFHVEKHGSNDYVEISMRSKNKK